MGVSTEEQLCRRQKRHIDGHHNMFRRKGQVHATRHQHRVVDKRGRQVFLPCTLHCSEAAVTIVLSNIGDNAFKPELYGDKIAITRSIKRSAGNSYTICGTLGPKSACRHKEVVSICDAFNIQVDNPLVILTQETAKRFLINSSPEDLYEVPALRPSMHSFL